MSTRVNGSVQMSAACRELLSQRLSIPLGASIALDDLSALLCASRPAVIARLQQLVGAPTLSTVLGKLAPAQFSRAASLLAAPGLPGGGMPVTGPQLTTARQTPDTARAARAELADAVAVAEARIARESRDLTADAFAGAAEELGYVISSRFRGDTASGLELRRQHELIMLLVHDDGTVESDHAGLSDAVCGSRQVELEAAARRRGITLTNRRELSHMQAGGGDLITLAARRRDPSLARAAVLASEQRAGRTVSRRLFEPGGVREGAREARGLRRGGAA